MPIFHAESALFFIPSNGRCFKIDSLELALIAKTVNIIKVKTTIKVRYTDKNEKQHKWISFISSTTYLLNERTNK